MTGDRAELEARFRERIEAFRRDYFRFTAAAAAVSLVCLTGLGAGTVLILQSLGLTFRKSLLPGAFVMGLFLAFGYLVYRKRHRDGGLPERLARLSSQALTFKTGRRRVSDWLAWGPDLAGVFYLLVPFIAIASLPYFFIREFLSGRSIFASEEAVALALEVLAEGGEKVDREFLERKFAGGGEAVFGALRLLAELKLFLVKGKGDDLHLLRTMEGQEFLEGNHHASRPMDGNRPRRR